MERWSKCDLWKLKGNEQNTEKKIRLSLDKMSVKRVCLFFYSEQIYELYHNLEKTMIIQMSPPQRGLLWPPGLENFPQTLSHHLSVFPWSLHCCMTTAYKYSVIILFHNSTMRKSIKVQWVQLLSPLLNFCLVRNNFSMYLFGCAGSLLQCTGFSCGAGTLERASSVVAAHRLSCPAAVPQAGIKATSPALEGGLATTEPPGKSQSVCSLGGLRLHLRWL